MKKILILDDDIISLKVISQQLINANYSVEISDNPHTGWRLLNEDPEAYSLILTDRMMLGLDAMELLHRVKQSPRLCHIPVIIFTGEAEPEDKQAILAAGAYAFVYKPIEKKMLLELVTNSLAK